MRTATLSVVVAVLCISGHGISGYAQDPPQPKPAEPAGQQRPAPATESQAPVGAPAVAPPVADSAGRLPAAPQAEVDPSKMAAPAATKQPGVAGVDAKAYILGAEDMIFISVWKSQEFSGSHMIRPDGKITIPLIGEVEAAGLTPEDFGAAIQEKLKKVLREPDVSVSVTQVNSRRYFIEGEVNKPGEYKLVVPTRVLEALVNAGGFKDFAKQSDITIMRGKSRLKFNYKAAIKGKNLDQNVFLDPNDIIIVK
jgi:polysaccharide export outer membrane protein